MRIRPPFLALALLAFALRAFIPLGFMPAADGTLSLMICPDGFPPGLLSQQKTRPGGMGMPAHQRPGQGDPDGGHCSFCTGCSAAPPSPLLAALFLLFAAVVVITQTIAMPAGIRRVRIPQARAPPTFF